MEDWNKRVKLLRILHDDHDTKFVSVEGEVENNDGEKKTAVLLLEKTPFHFDSIVRLMQEDTQQFKENFINDIYHKYTVEAKSSCNDIKLAYIYPATPLHIKKYSKKVTCLISETGEVYEKFVRPYVEQNQLDPQWVHNIIDGKSERDRILFESEQFMVLPDIMWDGKDIDSLHILGFVKSHTIRSIRDFKSSHIPMLETMLNQTKEFIASKYGLAANRIRAFFHYPPSFYHVHVHFTSIQNRTCGCEVERAHLVQDVIDHLRLKDDYYQTKTLYYKLDITSPLHKILEDNAPSSLN